MNSVDLKFFQAVVKASSIGGAAFTLNTVQSNVTSRIKSLEDEVGAPLFHRSRKGVTLTAIGLQLVPYAERIGELLDEAKIVVSESEDACRSASDWSNGNNRSPASTSYTYRIFEAFSAGRRSS